MISLKFCHQEVNKVLQGVFTLQFTLRPPYQERGAIIIVYIHFLSIRRHSEEDATEKKTMCGVTLPVFAYLLPFYL